MDRDVEVMKHQRMGTLKHERVLMVVETEHGFSVEQWMPDGLAPSSVYPTAQAAGARVLQLLKIREPVTPQAWPEIAQIGGDGGSKPPAGEVRQ